ncbi:MAG: aquaporin [Planctomycetota bacterium]
MSEVEVEVGVDVPYGKMLIAEALGTFMLVLVGTGAIVSDQVMGGAVTHPGIALSFGLVVMVVIFAVGPTSGAHLNPAVTVAFALAGKFGWWRVPAYIGVQLGGGLLASVLVLWAWPVPEVGPGSALGSTLPGEGVTAAGAFVMEVVLTFLLMWVILLVATGSKEQGLLAAVAIGGTVGLEAMFAGPITGASMNPARSIAPAVVSGTWELLWLYVAAPVVGAALAVPAWWATRR